MDKMNALLKVENLKKYFELKRGFVNRFFSRKRAFIRAVDGLSFDMTSDGTLGVVGESGSGKTTLGRLILRLIEPTEGKIFFEGEDITSLSGKELRKKRRNLQVIFQDPTLSLNPYMSIGEAVRHPLVIHGIGTEREQRAKAFKALERVGLVPPDSFYSKYPHELSTEQRQRAVIAMALILKPKLVVADEPLSMLDVSVRAKILKLFIELKRDFNLAYLFITRDLSIAKYICDRIAVMYLGKIVELGSLSDIYLYPAHPYTKALLSATPTPDLSFKGERLSLVEEIPNPVDIPLGCRFHPRCPFSKESCLKEEPELQEISSGHWVACHFPLG